MKIIVCLDDRNGMLFAGRRQSMDRVLRQQALALAGEQPLWMNGYSAGQFGAEVKIRVDEAFLDHAPEDAWCFVENTDVLPYLNQVKTVVIFRWNRVYPRDTYFPMNELTARWKLVETFAFPGSSHERITQERYER